MGLTIEMDSTKVSIGLCVKNSASTIIQTIRSILYQDFPVDLLELVIVDGCSEDSTVSIINEMVSGKIKHRIFFEHEGIGEARQIVVDNAVGNYIVWVDGDMTLSKDYLSKLFAFMESHPEAGIAKGRYGLLTKQPLVAFLQNVDFYAKGLIYWGKNETKLTTNPLGSSGSIYRVNAIRQVGGFETKLKGGYEDMDVECKIRTSGWNVFVVNAIFFEHYRRSWNALWKEYLSWGYGAHCAAHLNPDIFLPPFPRLYAMLPLSGFAAGLLRSMVAYRQIDRKSVFLLPFQFTFKRVAFCIGYAKSHYERYGHNFKHKPQH